MGALKSQYLLDIKSYFQHHRRALASCGKLEFEEEPDPLVTGELWEVVLWLVSDVYLVLTVWGDSLATFIVREAARKRRHRVLLRIHEFALLASPPDVFAAFKDSAYSLFLLSKPPSPMSDRAVLDEMRTSWLSLSRGDLH